MERLNRKDELNKFKMSQCVDTTRGGFKTKISTLSCIVSKENTW